MHDLQPITPLGQKKPQVDIHGSVTLTENIETALASFAARMGAETKAKTALKAFIGGTPPAPGHATKGDISAIWMGPDQWMVMAPFASHEDLAQQLITKAKASASVTEQTDGWCRFDLTGQGLADVFERLCPAPVRSWTGGEATRTSIDHLGCFLVCHDPAKITVIGPRSSAGSLHHALLVAMKSAL